MLPGTCRFHDQIGMGFGRGTDQDSINGRIAQYFFALCNYAGDPTTLRHLPRRLSVSVGNCGRRRFWDAEGQALCMHLADSAGADDSDLESLLPQSLSPSLPLCESRFQRAQILTVAQRALSRRPHAGQHILFHQNITVVVAMVQPLQHLCKIYAAASQFAKNTVA